MDGLFIGLAIPAAIFGLLQLIVYFLPQIKEANVFNLQRMILISVIPNVLLLRYYLLKLKHDLTGRGILAITFIVALIFVIIEFSS